MLIVSYVAGLIFSLRTHRDLFNPPERGRERGRAVVGAPVRPGARRSPGVLVGVMSEILVGSISETAKDDRPVSEFFIGAIVVAIVGNAAEHWVAVLVAAKDKMDLAVNIAIGSSAQIALFVAPVLVLLSFVLGPNPMPLVFNGFELGAHRPRGDHRQPGHERGRVDLVRGRPAARRLPGAGAGVLLRTQ